MVHPSGMNLHSLLVSAPPPHATPATCAAYSATTCPTLLHAWHRWQSFPVTCSIIVQWQAGAVQQTAGLGTLGACCTCAVYSRHLFYNCAMAGWCSAADCWARHDRSVLGVCRPRGATGCAMRCSGRWPCRVAAALQLASNEAVACTDGAAHLLVELRAQVELRTS